MGASSAGYGFVSPYTPEQRAAAEARVKREREEQKRRLDEERARSRFHHAGKNPYSKPEACNVELVATLEADFSYEFDIIILIRDLETGGLYAAHDSGCSCPEPFEDLRELSDLTEVRTVRELEVFVSALKGRGNEWPVDLRLDFMRKARQAFP